MSSSNLFKENEELIEAKYKYLTDAMRIEIPEIVKSEAFSKSSG